MADITARASRPYSSVPRPFLKWAGSKRSLLGHVLPLLPFQFGVYREPFLGSGALFFLIRPKRAVLSDVASELIETFRAVRDNVTAVKRYLAPLQPSRVAFYKTRSSRSSGRFKRAAEFIYLNKTCWNGLYRVNSAGEFNVPYGWPKGPNIVDDANLSECSLALRQPGVQLRICDFEATLREAQPNDLVYLDPPYVTGHNNNGFIDYNETLFSWSDQVRLAAAARDLADQGVHVIVSNADHEGVIDLYRGFRRISFDRKSTLASDATKRRRVSEVLLIPHRQSHGR
ncbi:MAG: DNA adenine methylase [Longimicrobiaceae bacterium]